VHGAYPGGSSFCASCVLLWTLVLALLHYQQSTAKDQGAAVGGWSEHGRRQPGRRRALFLFSSSRIGFWPLGREATYIQGRALPSTNQPVEKLCCVRSASCAKRFDGKSYALSPIGTCCCLSTLSLFLSLFGSGGTCRGTRERETPESSAFSWTS
jgi:hypothetical protein